MRLINNLEVSKFKNAPFAIILGINFCISLVSILLFSKSLSFVIKIEFVPKQILPNADALTKHPLILKSL